MSSPLQRPIGIFDSGMGGLTLAHALKQHFPNEAICYLGDTAYLPYGMQTTAVLQQRIAFAIAQLKQQHCKLILIACNTAVAAWLPEHAPDAVLPILDVVAPITQHLLTQTAYQHIVLWGTRYTVHSHLYAQRLAARPDLQLQQLATPDLVQLLEGGALGTPQIEAALETYLQATVFDHRKTLLVLGCTHYELLRNQLKQYCPPQVDILATPHLVVQLVADQLQSSQLESTEASKLADQFLVTQFSKPLEQLAKTFFGAATQLQIIPPLPH